MFNECSVAVYSSMGEAQTGIQALDSAGFSEKQVSLVTHDVAEAVPQVEVLQYGDQSVRDLAKGAGMGGLLGVLLTSPLLVIPGMDPAILAGPLAAGATGAMVGGFLGGMAGWGVHRDHVQEYEEKLQQGRVLVVVNGDPDEVARAHGILQATGAVETHLHARTSADSSEVDDRPHPD